MAISKKRKDELVQTYTTWIDQSQAMIVTEYLGLSMKQIDELRAKIREVGGEFHVVKNTLGKVAFEAAGMTIPEKYFEGSTAIVFAFKDIPGVVKAVNDFSKTSEFVKVKGGFLSHSVISSADVKALAELPPLPVLQSQLMGALLAPAGKLARTLAEPARSLAAVLKAYAEKGPAQTVA